MVYSTVRVLGDVDDSGTRQRKRGVVGTGFLISVASETVPGLRYGYVVTADHAVSWQAAIEVQIPNPLGGGELYAPLPVDDWCQPLAEVDLAVAPIPRKTALTVQPLELETNLIPANVNWLQFGATVHYVGILVPLDRVMVRTGTIGAIDQTLVRNARDAPTEYGDYPLHLLDCRSYEGFSGSPCYLDAMFAGLTPTTDIPPHQPPPGGVPRVGNTYHVAVLCGMLIEHLEDRGRSGVASAYGVGLMLRGNEIREALMTNRLRDERSKWDTETAAL